MRGLLVLVAGCIPGPGSSVHDPTVDDDGDGFTEDDGDCDDTDAAVGLPSTWYLDADGDGHGVPEGSMVACAAPGRVAVSDDCDDADPATFPGAVDACDVDRACDGEPVDGDQDGFLDCEECDDDDAGVFPGAIDPCGGPDLDCDPLSCEIADLTVADAEFTLASGPDEGGFLAYTANGPGGAGVVGVGAQTRTSRDDYVTAGSRAWLVVGMFTPIELGFEDQGHHTRVFPVGDVVGNDGVDEWVVSSHCWDPDADDGCVDPGYAVVLDGSKLTDGAVGADGRLVGAPGDCVGMAAVPVDDGFAISGGCAGIDQGAVWMVDPSLVDLPANTDLGQAVRMNGGGDLAPGWTLAVGDLDANGHDDLAVGNYGAPEMQAMVVHDALLSPIAVLNDGVLITTEAVPGYSSTSGTQVAFLGADAGTDRLVVGIAGDPDDHVGRVYLDVPVVDGLLANSDVTLEGPASFGGAVADLGDVDGDGIDDLGIGAPDDDDSSYVQNSTAAGTAYVVSGAEIALPGVYSIDNVALLRVVGGGTAHLGVSIVGGDLDGDGLSDLIVGQEDTRTAPAAAWFLDLTSDGP